MKFYDRQKELAELQTLFRQSHASARMMVLTGRRRVGKTLLALEFAAQQAICICLCRKIGAVAVCGISGGDSEAV